GPGHRDYARTGHSLGARDGAQRVLPSARPPQPKAAPPTRQRIPARPSQEASSTPCLAHTTSSRLTLEPWRGEWVPSLAGTGARLQETPAKSAAPHPVRAVVGVPVTRVSALQSTHSWRLVASNRRPAASADRRLRLAGLPRGLALLQERAHTLLGVLALTDLARHLEHVFVPRIERSAHAAAHGGLHRAQRQRSIARDLLGQRGCNLCQLGVGNDFV